LNSRWSVIERSDWPIDVQQHLREQVLGEFCPAFARTFWKLFEGAIDSCSPQLITDERSLQTAARLPVWMIGNETFLSGSAFMTNREALFSQS